MRGCCLVTRSDVRRRRRERSILLRPSVTDYVEISEGVLGHALLSSFITQRHGRIHYAGSSRVKVITSFEPCDLWRDLPSSSHLP